ncbi:MAG: stage 0 sporulation protein [Desulfobacteraceae bacterium]|nr:MAG: stage 0 sporulation protein [Desulfobacteraceae bacterium]
MSKLVDIQFPKYGKVGVFDAGDLSLAKGDKVLVESELGPALGTVCSEPLERGGEWNDKSLPKVLRPAEENDLRTYEQNRRLEREVYEFCYGKIQERGLAMNLVSVDRLFEGGKIMVYFTAEGRIDFRELVKDLVQRFRTRIEMRQIGVRHQAKMVGGLGGCGRQLCCTTFLSNFDPVSIKMAKEQNLSLNPSKISGMCGRLMCCLSYEYRYYENARKGIPKVGKRVKTTKGEGKVVRQNVLKRVLTVLLDSGEEQDVSYDDVIRNPAAAQPAQAKGHDKGKESREDPENSKGAAEEDRTAPEDTSKEKEPSDH